MAPFLLYGRKSGAKVLPFFELCKYFERKSIFFLKKLHISVESSTFAPLKIHEMMKMRIIYLLLLLCSVVVCSLAQDVTNTLPDLQTAEPDFFDPTRKTVVKEEYKFSTDWRWETGYTQLNQKQDTSSLYLHGVRLGATVDFNLPYRFSIQTGVLAALTYGRNNQHWASLTEESAQVNVMQHNIIQLQLTLPVRACYNIKLWKELRMFFYAGPQLQIGLTSYDVIQNNTSELTTQWLEQQGIATTPYDRYVDRELYRTNIQFGLGGGFEWDRYRLQAGYDFGLNNILKTSIIAKQKMNEWGWMCTFSYQL
jgi:hypothetical protein